MDQPRPPHARPGSQTLWGGGGAYHQSRAHGDAAARATAASSVIMVVGRGAGRGVEAEPEEREGSGEDGADAWLDATLGVGSGVGTVRICRQAPARLVFACLPRVRWEKS